MSNSTNDSTSIIKRYAVIFVLMAGFVLAFLYAAGMFGGRGVTAQQFVNLQENEKPNVSFRRAHAKGVCLQGEFVASGLLAPFTTAEFFQKGNYPFIGRFSIGGGNPTAPDLASGVRSLALSFASDSGQRWRTAMNTPTVMAVRTPEVFFQQIKLLTPDPKTGKRDEAKIKAFFAAHPEMAEFNQWKANYVASSSFATEKYHSINAFYLVNDNGERQAVRWAMTPQAEPQPLGENISDSHPDALQIELAQRLENDVVRFDMLVTLANDSDDENNPTVVWPAERAVINAGTVVIRAVEPQQGGTCNGINFDPLVLPKGMEATADPILNARGAVYAESYRRRARESFQQQADSQKTGQQKAGAQ